MNIVVTVRCPKCDHEFEDEVDWEPDDFGFC